MQAAAWMCVSTCYRRQRLIQEVVLLARRFLYPKVITATILGETWVRKVLNYVLTNTIILFRKL